MKATKKGSKATEATKETKEEAAARFARYQAEDDELQKLWEKERAFLNDLVARAKQGVADWNELLARIEQFSTKMRK